ncbi:MAG: alkaline phosphatase family protein [Lachnospiraceae bacterium]|nr:alkaline phosphatase family protein [Lachnospiraceae bacterium]
MKKIRQNAKKSTGQRLIMISLDAVGQRDIAYLCTLPNFKSLWERAAKCAHVQSVYPSITYPAHVSIVTGKKPVHHRVINNTRLQPKRPAPDWLWQRRFVKGTTLYDEALKKGWKVAALLWPVTARSRITYNLPEIFANRPWQNQVMVSAYNGSALYEMDLYRRFGHMMDGIRQPALDNFVHASALYTIRYYNPEMMLIHFTDVDTNRHIYGVEHPKVTDALDRHDKRLGELMDALEVAGDMDKTTVVILGDHCQYQTERVVYFNYLLKKAGFLKSRGDVITDYTYISKNCDGCTYIYENPKKKATKRDFKKLTALLEKCKENPVCGIDRIFTGKEAGELGADDRCVYLIEAKAPVFYLDACHTLTEPVEEMKKGKMRAVHGYLPDKPDYETFFMAFGYGIKEGVEIPSMHLYDEGPTLAKIIGVTLPDADGRCFDEILK